MNGGAGGVVLGLGGCLDCEVVWDEPTLQRLADRYAITAAEIGREVAVDSERDLVRSVLGYVRDGAGGERFVATPEIVEAFAARFPRHVTLGGTSLRAAIAMSQLGLPSMVHLVSIDEQMRCLLPTGVAYLCSAEHDSKDPHLIVQFPAGARVHLGDDTIRAPRANRLIYVNDQPNREMVLSPELGRTLESARIFLISGLNTVQDVAILSARLSDLRSHMDHLPSDALVVFEDAGYHVPELSAHVRAAIRDRVDIHGMNEDELEGHLGRPVDLLDAASVAGALRDVKEIVRAPTIVVHTQYWALGLGGHPERFRSALEMGVSTAAARYLHGDDITAEELRRIALHPRKAEGLAVARSIEGLLGEEVCCVPAFEMSPATPTTVGLGDAFVGGFIAGLVATSLESGDGDGRRDLNPCQSAARSAESRSAARRPPFRRG